MVNQPSSSRILCAVKLVAIAALLPPPYYRCAGGITAAWQRIGRLAHRVFLVHADGPLIRAVHEGSRDS